MNAPNSYDESTESIIYHCAMCSIENSTHYISLEDFPDDALTYLYRRVSKIDESIRREDDDSTPRFETLTEVLEDELSDRGIDVPETTLTHMAHMDKQSALDAQTDVPSIIQIGRADGDYDLHTLPEEMGWVVPTTTSEATLLESDYGATVEPLD